MWEQPDREARRSTFGTVGEQYDRARPEYPNAVFDDIAELACLAPGARVLEIGPGTGKATAELVRRGWDVTGVELSLDLAELARRNAPGSTIEVADFEEWEPPAAGFDAVTAFTSIHWIAPELRCAKPARLLGPGGAFCVVAAPHVLPPGGDTFWLEVQEDYRAVLPGNERHRPIAPDEVNGWKPELEASGLFRSVVERRHLQALHYTADEYVDVWSTYSNNLSLPAARRDELARRIHGRIARRGDHITMHQLVTVTVGRAP